MFRQTLSFVLLIVAFFLYSCEYEIRQYQHKLSSGKVPAEIDVDSDFDWKMEQEIVFLIKNASNEIINITSSENSLIYHKGYSGDNSYTISVNLPKRVTQVKINEHLVTVDNKAVVFTFPSVKSTTDNLLALCFDGLDDYGETDNLVTSYPFTMCTWIKPQTNPNPADDMAVVNMATSSNSNRMFGIYISYTELPAVPAGTISLKAKNGNSDYIINSSTVVEPGRWYHVAVVYTNKTNRKIYVNGNLQGSDIRSVNLPNMDVLGIARWADRTPSGYFNGSIDEVKIWKATLTQTQIEADMNAVLTGNEANLKGYWPFEEGSGLITDDLSPSNNDVLISSGTAWCDGSTSDDADGDGIPDEDDEYPDDPARAFNNQWPAATGTLAFEDLWPSIADYDFNDLVMDYLFNSVTNADNEVVETFAIFTVKATGAGLNNGFGFALPGIQIPSENLLVTGMQADNGIVSIDPNGLEAGQNGMVIIVYDDVPKVGNTRPEVPYNQPVEIILTFNITDGGPYFISDLGLESFDPFIFVNQVRSHEIHLANYPPTDLADPSLFGTLDDATNPPGIYYKSIDNLPWALNFPEMFDYPTEKNSIWIGHLKFIEWINSGGTLYNDWYTNQAGYRDDEKIYSVQP